MILQHKRNITFAFIQKNKYIYTNNLIIKFIINIQNLI